MRAPTWRDAARLANAIPGELVRATPYAAVLALALGLAVVVGANLSNAQPSESRPFGWPGPSTFEFGVAMVRADLVLATTLPALLLGARALEGRSPVRDGVGALAATFGWHALALVLGVLAAGGIGAWGSFKTPWETFYAFSTAHALLALAFYSLGALAGAAVPRFATPVALAVWAGFVLLYDNTVQWRVLREIGYPGVTTGAFPAWFYAAQALSPLTAYRAVLILWRPGFRNYVEQYALEKAVLPEWMVPATFVGLLLALWVLLPLGLALAAWKLRAWRSTRAAGAATS